MRIVEWFKGLFKKAEPEKKVWSYLTDKERREILSLKKNGVSQRDIGRKINKSQATVHNVIKKEKERTENARRTKKRGS